MKFDQIKRPKHMCLPLDTYEQLVELRSSGWSVETIIKVCHSDYPFAHQEVFINYVLRGFENGYFDDLRCADCRERTDEGIE
jgi:hypothetical protein